MVKSTLFSITSSYAQNDQVDELMWEYKSVDVVTLSLSKYCQIKSPIIISVIKNECSILKDFLDHYRSLGIEKFVFIDNASLDNTVNFLTKQEDVDLYRVSSPFSTSKKQAWINLIARTYGSRNNWFIYADADEHIVFDDKAMGYKLPDFANLMDRLSITRVRGCLIDMYAKSLIPEISEVADTLVKTFPYFDGIGYKEYRLPQLIAREGGVRQRIFKSISAEFRPQLTKYPMFRLDDHEIFVNPHYLWPYDKNLTGDCLLGILHFKFLPNFLSKVDTAISEGVYWNNSFEYRCYKEVIVKYGNVPLYGEESVCYEGARSLVEHNLISPLFP